LSKPAIGAHVMYCGHNGWFLADIFKIGNVNVVRAAAAKVDPGKLHRDDPEGATHHLKDFPTTGFWRPDLGVFVVPASQVTEIKR
jgi:hypothetical protein